MTWNSFFVNKKQIRGIKVILALRPDVVCLQEIRLPTLQWLHTLRGYTVHSCKDWINIRSETKNCYTCTLTKQKPMRVNTHTFGPGPVQSILNTILYKKILKNIEQHTTLVVTIKTSGTKLQIANTRLSCASDILSRIDMFHNMIQSIRRKHVPTIYCGDFNVVDSGFFKLCTGWLRGFHLFDYRINERIAFEILFAKERLVNIFRGKSTVFVNRPLLQFDHILVPIIFTTESHHILRKRYGSDHRMLLGDIALSNTSQ